MKFPHTRMLAWLGTAGILAMLAWLAAVDGGYFSREFLTAAVAGWAVAGLIILAGWDRLEIPQGSGWPLIMLAAIFAWTGLSTIWSIGPDSSLMEFARVSIYLTGFMAVLSGARNRRKISISVAFFVALMTALAAFALLAKVSPDYSQTYAFAGGRLMGSLGYWNALAILMVMGILPCLWLSSSREVSWGWRPAATAALMLMGLTLFFTLSRGGILVGVFALLVYLAVTPRRLGLIFTLAAAWLPAGLIAWRTYTALPTLHAAPEGFAIDPSEGRQFAYLLFAGLVAAAALKAVTLILPDRIPPTRGAIAATAAAMIIALVVVAGIGVSQRDRISSEVDSLRNAAQVQPGFSGVVSSDARGVARLASTSDQRTELWQIGMQNFSAHPVLGTGAATYYFANLRLESGVGMARDPHSIWVRFLSDQGIVGFTLLLGFLVTLGVGLIAPMWPNRELRRDGLYLSLVLASAAWIADSSLEWNWAMPAVALTFFLINGLALRLASVAPRSGAAGTGVQQAADGGIDEKPLRIPVWLRMAVLMSGITLSIIFMALLVSTILGDRGRDRLLAGDIDSAAVAASRAHRLDPFATGPLVIESQIAVTRGDYAGARDRLVEALKIEPQQSALYRRLAVIEFYYLGATKAGIDSLSQAIDLDPQERGLHLLLHQMVYDQEIYNRTGRMPPVPEQGDS
ncbi:MAG: O-antigen ligase family protein [Actinobacteria bacterium]|nr:O-antigen ligase family protein [Actinomycetota bacterium]